MTFADFEFGRPIKKLSGLMSRYIKFFSCIVCTRESYRTVSSSIHCCVHVPYHLFRYHYNRLYRESSIAVIEEVFKTGAKEIYDEDVVETFLAEVIDVRYTSYKCISRTHGYCG